MAYAVSWGVKEVEGTITEIVVGFKVANVGLEGVDLV